MTSLLGGKTLQAPDSLPLDGTLSEREQLNEQNIKLLVEPLRSKKTDFSLTLLSNAYSSSLLLVAAPRDPPVLPSEEEEASLGSSAS
jgi:hypothetical protein